MTPWTMRPMSRDDLVAAERISDVAFYDVDQRTFPRAWPDPERRSEDRSARWIERTRRLLDTDPGGCWAAEDDTGLLGFATSMVRERVWLLATFAVRPGLQGRGIGRRLLTAAQEYGAGCDRGMLAASDDPPALRRYWAAGFTLHPQMVLRGRVDRSVLPVVAGLREGTAGDREWMDALDRDLRGGPHGPDHDALADMGRLVVAEDRSGYAYADAKYVSLLAARDEATAATLLWECLAGAPGEVEVPHLTAANPWAVDVGMQARLGLWTSGYLGVRGMAPPAPYVHNGPLL